MDRFFGGVNGSGNKIGRYCGDKFFVVYCNGIIFVYGMLKIVIFDFFYLCCINFYFY